jgi:squalene synthase HpnC
MPVDHYENFPVASLLVPAACRRPIEIIYRFARSADDLADEGEQTPEQRLAALAAYVAELDRIERGEPPLTPLFVDVAGIIATHRLPIPLFRDLISAFAQDVTTPRYADYATLLDYCRRSANPVGRLLLHLFGHDDDTSLRRSDAICTALQLINFWQDMSVDLPRGRIYVTVADAGAFGLDARQLRAGADSDASRALVRALVAWARSTMHGGVALVHRLPGRIAWEMALVVQGGLRVLEKIEASDCAALSQRPTIAATDLPLLAWRACRMMARPPARGVAAAHDRPL